MLKLFLEVSPIPNHNIIIGIKANGGVCLKNSNILLKYIYILGNVPKNIPKGRAKKTVIENPIPILFKLIPICFINFPFFKSFTAVKNTFSG